MLHRNKIPSPHSLIRTACILTFLICGVSSCFGQASGESLRLDLKPANTELNQWTLSWDTETNFVYYIEQSEDHSNWYYVSYYLAEEAAAVEETLATGENRLFFRVRFTEFTSDNTSPLLTDDFDGDLLSNYDEINTYSFMGLDPLNSDSDGNGINDGLEDADGDSRNNALEFTEKTDPMDYYDGTLPNLTIVSGDGQTVGQGAITAEPVIVRVDNNTNALENAPLEVSVSPANSGTLQADGSLLPSTSIRTDLSGEVAVDFIADADFTGQVTINFLAQSGNNQTAVQAILNVLQQLSFSLFAGVDQTYIQKDRQVSAAGSNSYIQIPGQSQSIVDQFSIVSGLPLEIVKIAAGADHALALTSEGLVYAWGDNFFGQLGLGDFQGRSQPTLISGLSDVLDISAGDGFSSFLVDNGDSTTTVYLSGNLQDGLKSAGGISNLPIVSGQTGHPNAIQLAASGRRLMLLCEDSSVWGWGDNTFRQVNPASANFQLDAATEIIPSGVVSVSVSPDNSLVILNSGELKAWGTAAFEQLTDGVFDPSTGIYSLSMDVVRATAGNGFIAYLDESNNLSTAGLNDAGQLGRDTGGAMIASAGSVALPTADTIVSLVSGDRHLIYLTVAEEIYGFGDNSQGALGKGITEQLSTPTLLTPNLN